MEPIDLELVPTDRLIDEASGRYDAFVAAGVRYLQDEEGEMDSWWKGDENGIASIVATANSTDNDECDEP